MHKNIAWPLGLSKIIAVLWVSFVFSGIATLLFFATFDPLEIIQYATYAIEWQRTTFYSVGFLLFWILTSANSFIAIWLLVPINSHK